MHLAAYSDNRLTAATVVAVILHLLIIFGIGFKFHEEAASASSLEITLVRKKSEQAPETSDYIAAHNQQGSGDSPEKEQLSTDKLPLLEAAELRDTDIPVPVALPEKKGGNSSDKILAADSNIDTTARENEGEPTQHHAPALPQQAHEIASLRAKLRQQQQQHNKLPRTLVLTTASARASAEAEYLRHWIEWVEKIGNENYPEEARRKRLFGAIRLAVSLDRKGNISGVEIIESSGQRVLDQAAIRIVRLAAPFKPVPATITEDRVEVIRTWNFIPGHQLVTD